jgi:hypothetical protein
MAAEPTLRRSSLERQQIKNRRDLVQKARLPASIRRNWCAPLNPLVMDNLSSHHRKALVDRFGEKIGGLLWERFTVHYTPQTRQLAESGGDRDQPVLPSVPGPTENPVARTTTAPSNCMEPENELRPCHHQLASSRARRHARSSATTETKSHGQRPRAR